MLENVPGVKFVRPPARNQSERICSYYSHSSAIEKSFQNSYDDYNNIFHAAKIIRNEIKEQEKWQFNGSYDGFTIPKSLEILLRWIIGGPKMTSETKSSNKEIEKSVEIMSELVINMSKSDRQIRYASNRNQIEHRQMTETPFTVGLGLHLHKSTRSKVLIEHMSNLNLCISHDKILKIENAIANSVL